MRAPIAHNAGGLRAGGHPAVALAALLVLGPLPLAAASPGPYTVQPGDTLWDLAEHLRPDQHTSIQETVRLLFEHNPHAFTGDERTLQVGAVLSSPDTPAGQARAAAPANAASPRAPQPTNSASADSVAASPAGETRREFVFGERPDEDTEAETETGTSAWDLRVDETMVELGVLGTSGRPVDYVQHGRAVVSARRNLNEDWDLRLGARMDVQAQQGGDYPRTTRARADYDENFLRYRGDRTRITVGTQRILWGRVDEIPPTDRLSTKDLTRFGLDPYGERRRANPAIRAEFFEGPWHADLVFLPIFRPAELPDRDSLWHPVDRNRGRLLGLPQDPALAPLIEQATLDDDVSGNGGAGVRLGRSGRGADFAVTIQRARHSQPYYRFDADTRQAILTGQPAGDPTLEAVHPRTWVVGGDTAFATGAWTWRAEAAWLSDVPVTRADDLRQTTVEGVDWVIGAEGFPGDGDFRMTTQLAGQHLLNAGDMLDARESYFLTGELESPFAGHNWRARMRYSVGLNRRDIYLNPELAWIAREPMEFYIGLHWLDGAEGTAGGFYRDNRMLVTGWRGQF
ncbi:LysM peptidoglycan-binding domain-containing protein [Thioalkalivibrio sp. ALM2T]|uniref:LysM peptidoglycan-binding domain-containing protein n=1 Tax=Thioalkalivibrio sp. ALM2T TaxID=1158184 RepID=UPI00047594E6|nr:LysM peptidoglycan-binding domain-containing protein [Thioalkalivibrio sp. ALM2T]